MIDLKDPKKQNANLIGGVGVALVLASALATIFLRPPTADKARKAYNKLLLTNQTKVEESEAKLLTSKAIIAKKMWSNKVSEVQPLALDIVSKLAKERKISLISFRPQKQTEGSSLTQLPFALIVDGSFINVATMISTLESSDSKLAVNQVQFASKEGESDQITANINLVAYVDIPKKKDESKPATSTSKSSPSTADAKAQPMTTPKTQPTTDSKNDGGNNGQKS